MNGSFNFLLVSVVSIVFAAAVEAQQPKKMSRMGLLTAAGSPSPQSPSPLDLGLRKLGYVEGQNISIEGRYANGQLGRFLELATELVSHPLDVIMAQSYPAALAAKQTTDRAGFRFIRDGG